MPSTKHSRDNCDNGNKKTEVARSLALELIGDKYENKRKWSGMVSIGDCLYCIPCNAKQILKINPTTGHTSLVGEKHAEGELLLLLIPMNQLFSG